MCEYEYRAGVPVSDAHHTMTDARLTDGERGELTATLVSRRVLDCGGTLVRRLLVRDAGANEGVGDEDASGTRRDTDIDTQTEERRHLALLVAPAADTLADLGVGQRVRFEGVVGCTLAERTDERCPDCDGRLSRATVLDTLDPALRTAARRLGLTGTFGVVTAETSVTRLDHEDGDGDGDGDDGDPIDDRQSEREPTPESTSVAAPSGLVCPDCGGQFDLGTPAPARGDADEGSGGMRDLAGLVPLPHALAHGEPRSWTVQGAWRCEADGNAIEPRRVD